MGDERMFPLQSSYRSDKAKPHPTRIPWSVADKAYAVYRSRYGSQQTLERLAERGGFSAGEMDDFYPGWREEVDELSRLRSETARLTAELDKANTRVDRLRAECLAWRAWLTKFRSVLEGGHLSSPVDTSGVELARAACDTHHDLTPPGDAGKGGA